MNNQWFSKIAVWMVIAMVLFTVFKQFDGRTSASAGTVGYSEFLDLVKSGGLKSATIQEGPGGTDIVAITTDDRRVRTTATYLDRGLVGDLINNNVKFDVRPREEGSLLMTLLVSWGPMLLLIGVWIYFMRQMQGGGKGGAFSFGKSKARMLDENNNTVTFADVAGCDEAKEEVKEVVDFLKDPAKFQKLGGRIPRGLLLVGPPGTGKTLLAKGIAGEAKVPFFSISGSDFVEMFVGVGAARVRDMFDNAKKNAPCIIFIDEIDAVGRQRGAGLGGGNDEREQTLNQMLVEMDGFETNVGVIVVAATNRPDILDAALLRPGRFDRQVYVTLPDIRGREQILNVHMRKVPLGTDVNPSVIARGTPGMSGADLANLCNEAALMAARRNARVVEMQDFEKAKDKIFMGPERKSMVMPEEERRNTAYHESGHALIGKLLPKCDPVHKVTIIPRGRALGVTMSLPAQDRYSYDKDYMLNQISMLFGGRIAEEVFMNQMTTGASNDFERATSIARDMVMRYGMTDALGPMVYAENEGEVFLGRSVTKTTNMSEQTMQKVDGEVRRIIDQQYKLARDLIEEHTEQMHAMAKALLEWETIDAEQIDDIMAGKPPRPPKDWTPRNPSVGGGDSGGTPAVNTDPAPTAA
ncbi:MAG: ATP-dependent zinc metalloprotease FtsH [Hydrogenophaga sp.]|uniref:ATP-dependent zinc metalloprotease FtsH n=1 Tax=Hydrogenophaga sp. TaxID=1904254 RepID=UPI002723985D|nr:ATP-dependent zinc metalloprotease FtsH [Hydrogenophaga sp.]MDO9572007.1 ATP-dependent zinc metalloprotease FtsH [Hydrogenophaga sp.]MDP2222659.1 ATP-dependent zinc metalloprotease FtsH [Hydrogenophaga sp.]MDP3344713.1 ATP-dependent zinc metalloprotease FtsH [Hydrogenophaga sp.]MDP3373561.1 ATP-dependent zinc metalloprotease FtsH [Hydrogenophaga sp.]MDP3808103.1 ATP-dependent zinc metalloprotease FtsH [Hydrogenophaga sp.]